ncbi:hypothetical protein BD779DRAFT_205266 [Infundibulicybe gibba]|nr:hypothetical protein BD779DRAFT_205266 [Infundibulicybe gibba]
MSMFAITPILEPEYLSSEKVENPGAPVGCISYISVPPKPDGATLAEYPDGWSECLVTDKIKSKILSTPGFPASLPRAPKAHCIGSAPGKGLGIFSTRDLDVGDLIYAERPLLVLPSANHLNTKYPQGWTLDQVKRAVMFESEKLYYRAFERLEPEDQEAYLSLANIHPEDSITRGICRTNGFAIDGLDDIVDTFKAPYTGVCKEFSRANHSCSPNTARYFDWKSFACCFSAVRPIKSGEEITVGYGVIGNIRSVRQKDHQKYKFDCDCPACGPDFEVSDQNRRDIVASAGDLGANYMTWLEDKTLPKDEVIKTSRWWIKAMESEGLERLDTYGRHLDIIHRAYVALGDEENAIKHGVLLGKWRKATGWLTPPTACFSDPRHLRKRSDWAIRKA